MVNGKWKKPLVHSTFIIYYLPALSYDARSSSGYSKLSWTSIN